jgi:hypothetical protein
MAGVKPLQDPRDRKIDYDLGKVDYDWVANQTDQKELRKALAALREDAGFPHLTKEVEKRLGELDPAYKRRMDA